MSCAGMGAHDAVVEASTQVHGAELVDRDGNVISEISGDEFGHRVGGDLGIVRGDLCEIRVERASDVDVVFGDVIEDITEAGDGTEVTFRDADARAFDLVIGPDGLHSNARRIVFGDESQFLRDLGMYLCVFRAELPASGPYGGAEVRGRSGGGDLEHSRRPDGQGVLRLRLSGSGGRPA
jgi:2-polyprenyl-6-methoxyphenol hydroxylase-like FAD-dependent oxidoreductase